MRSAVIEPVELPQAEQGAADDRRRQPHQERGPHARRPLDRVRELGIEGALHLTREYSVDPLEVPSAARPLVLLTGRGATSITVLCALAAPEGLRRLEESGLPLRVFTASVDERLNENAYIVPGLGDAGDRQFGAV